MGTYNVVDFDYVEACMIKKPKEYPNFVYDNNTNGGVLNKIDEISKKIDEIKKNIITLSGEYEKLKKIYSEFTDFNSTMDSNIKGYLDAIGAVSTSYKSLNDNMKAQVNELAKEDETFLADVDNLTDNLKSEADIAREVISGKWGNGPSREAALAAAGYSAASIQGIVNQMIKGIYKEETKPSLAPATPTSDIKTQKEDVFDLMGAETSQNGDIYVKNSPEKEEEEEVIEVLEDFTEKKEESTKQETVVDTSEKKDNTTGKKVQDFTYTYDKTVKATNSKEVKLSGDKQLSGYISQGMTDAGKYKIYGFIKKSGDTTTGSAIRIVDSKGNVVKTFTTNDASVIGHVNDLEYDEKTGKVYIATMNEDNPIRSFNLNDAINSKSNNIKFTDEKQLYEDSGLKSGVSGITIDNSTGNIYLAKGSKVKVMNEDHKVLQTIIKPDDKTTYNEHQNQGIYAKDGDLYVIRYNASGSRSNGGSNVKVDSPSASANMVDIFHDGQYVKTVSVQAPVVNGHITEMESLTYNEKTGSFNANFYYSGGYATTEIKF